MRLDISRFSSFAKQALYSAEHEFEGEVNVDTLLYIISLMPQFDMAFDGDKRIFKSNMKEVIEVYKHSVSNKEMDKKYVSIDTGLKIILSGAYDIVFNPTETKFMKNAKKANVKTANGLKMLLYQAIIAFELWTEQKVKEEIAEWVYNLLEEEFIKK